MDIKINFQMHIFRRFINKNKPENKKNKCVIGPCSNFSQNCFVEALKELGE